LSKKNAFFAKKFNIYFFLIKAILHVISSAGSGQALSFGEGSGLSDC